MREVARRAGVSHQAPYHHFVDREAILAAIVGDGFKRLREDMVAAIAGINDPVDRLTAIGRAYVGFALAQPACFKLMFRSELVRAERHEATHACAQSLFEFVVSVVDDVARAKYGRAHPPLVIASWSLAHGLATLLLEDKLEKECGADKTQAANAVFDTFGALVRVAASERCFGSK